MKALATWLLELAVRVEPKDTRPAVAAAAPKVPVRQVCVLGAVLAHGGSPGYAFALGLGSLVVVVLSVLGGRLP